MRPFLVLFVTLFLMVTSMPAYAADTNPNMEHLQPALDQFYQQFFDESNTRDYDVAPVIQNIELIPDTPFGNYPRQIRVEMTNDAVFVRAKVSADGGSSWYFVTLTAQNDSIWTGTLGTFPPGTTVDFFLQAEDDLGQKTLEAYPIVPDGNWPPGLADWTSILIDPADDVGNSDLDVTACHTAYDADYFYARLKVDGDISGGSIWPWDFEVHIYAAGIKNPSDNSQYGLIYVPLADDAPGGDQDVIALRTEPDGDTVPGADPAYDEDGDVLKMRCLFDPMDDNPLGYYRLKYGTAYVENLAYDIVEVDSTIYCHFYPRYHTFTTVENEAPVANAGTDQVVDMNEMVQLDGTASNDPDGGPVELSYTWNQTAGPPVTLDDSNSPTPVFQAPTVVSALNFQLVVSDGLGESAPSTVSIYIANSPPEISQLDPVIFLEDESFVLDLSGVISDPNNSPDELEISWQMNDLIDITEMSPFMFELTTWEADQFGDTELSLTVSDPYGGSTSGTLNVTVLPVNDAPEIVAFPEIIVEEDSLFQLDLDDYVMDVDHEPSELTWEWEWLNSLIQNRNAAANRNDSIFVEIAPDSHILTVWAAANWFGGPESIVFRVTDDSLAMDEATTTVTITSVDDAPTFVDLPDSLYFFADSTVCLTVTDYADDIDTAVDALDWTFTIDGMFSWDFDAVNAELCLHANSNSDQTGTLRICMSDTENEVCADVFLIAEEALGIESGSFPTANHLYPARPNPFQQTATIQYSLKHETAVTIAIFDINGRRIQTLVDKNQAAGYHSIRWNGRTSAGQTVASGVYFFQIQTPDWRETRKLLKLR